MINYFIARKVAQKAEDTVESVKVDGQSKKKKKNRKDKKEGRKRRKDARAAEAEAGIKSSLKTGRFGDTGNSNLKPTQLFEDHDHTYKQEYVQASVKLREDNKHVESMQSFKLLALETKKKVDQNLVLEPVASGVKQG